MVDRSEQLLRCLRWLIFARWLKSMKWIEWKCSLTLLLIAATAAGAPEKAERRERMHTDAYGDPLPPGALARLGSVRLRPPGGARVVAFSPDNKILASGGDDGFVRLWDRRTGKEIHRLKGQETYVEALAFTPDGKVLASATRANDQPVFLWDVASGKEIRQLPGLANGTSGLAFSPDGKQVVTAGGRIIRVRELSMGKVLWHVDLGEPNGVWRVAYSPDGRAIVSTGSSMRMWDAVTGKELQPFLTDAKGIRGIAFAPDGKKLLTVKADETVRLWEIATGKELWRRKMKDWNGALTFAPDGRTIALACFPDLVRLWEASTGKEINKIQNWGSNSALAFAPDGKTLAGAGGVVPLWNPTTGEELFPQGHQNLLSAIGFAPDGKTLASMSWDDTVRVWDAASGKELRRTEEISVLSSTPTFTLDGRLLLLERRVGEVRLWDVMAGIKPRRFKVVPPADPFRSIGGGAVHAAALTADGKRVAAHDDDGTVRVWDVGTGKELCRIKTNNSFAAGGSIDFSPDGQTIAISSEGLFEVASGKKLYQEKDIPLGLGYVMASALGGKLVVKKGADGLELWDVPSGKQLRTLRLPRRNPFARYEQTAFAPGGRTLASRTSSDAVNDSVGVVLWDVRTSKVLGQFTERDNYVLALAFSPDGRTLALGLWDHTVRLWDAFTGQEICRFRGHQDAISAIAFTADGHKLASGSLDGTGLIWDLTGEIAAKPLDAGTLHALWDDLGGTDAPRADRAFWTLTAAPKQAIPLLREQLIRAKPIATPNLNRLIADLDDDRFDVREKAEKELARLAERAESALRRALDKKPSLEVRRHIERLLARLEQKPGDLGPLAVRELRAVRILEQIGTREAQEVLEMVESGAEDPALAGEAGAALLRRERRK
jgi:WD40 repeat protein